MGSRDARKPPRLGELPRCLIVTGILSIQRDRTLELAISTSPRSCSGLVVLRQCPQPLRRPIRTYSTSPLNV